MKRIITVLLSFVMCLCFSSSAMATDLISAEDKIRMTVYSPDFPDAYIIQNEANEEVKSSSTKSVSATVFVEEEYGLDRNGEPVTISSKLLSESEVRAIGIDNFGTIEDAREKAVNKALQTGRSSSARGTLDLFFWGIYSTSGNSVSCDLSGSASWSAGPGLFNGSTNPADGSDYMGVVWSGGFECSNSSIDSTSSIPIYEPPVLNMCAAKPNAGRVWEFTEAWAESMMGQGVSVYLTNIDVDVTITKANMTGGGNYAEAQLKYIHTYSSVSGSISISASSSGISGGFSLSNVQNQWSLVCTVSGIPY